MTTISKLAEIDPVFREVVSKLYPEIDPRELWDIAKLNDGSEAHVPGNNKLSTGKKVAIGSGIVLGLGADLVGAKATIPDAVKATRTIVPDMKNAAGFKNKLKVLKPIGEGSLTGINTATGVATGALLLKPKKNISKAEFLELVEPILKARRDGVIDTPKALDLIEEVEKGLLFDWKEASRAVKNPHSVAAMKLAPEYQAKKSEEIREQTNAAIHRGRVIYGTGAVVGTMTLGVKAGKKAEAKQAVAPVQPVKKSIDYGFEGEISKVDEEKRQVFGWASLTTVDGQPVVDLQNDYISIEEIEKAAYDYVMNSRKGGDMHSRIGDDPLHVSDMIESVIITPDKLRKMGVPDEAISKVNTGWWVGYQVNDEQIWEKVKKNERTGFSIHGTGIRKDTEIDA
jgi:hypothetical protein